MDGLQGLRRAYRAGARSRGPSREILRLVPGGRDVTSVVGRHLDEHRDEDTLVLCRGDFRRFATEATRGLLESTGVTFKPYSDFHYELVELAESHRRLAVLAPRDHLKSTILSQLHPLYHAAYQPRGFVPRQLLVADTGPQAKENLDYIKQFIECNEWLRHLKPEGRTGWTRTSIQLTNGSIIRVKGFGSPVRGSHYDRVVGDDILGDTQRFSFDFIRRFIKRVITPMVKKGGDLHWVGTPQHFNDPLMELMENPAYHGVKYQAVLDWDRHVVLWPEGWDWDGLMSVREEIGTVAFSQEYQCEPVDDSSSLFPWSVLESSFAPNMSLQGAYDGEFPVYAGVDVAKSARIGADWWVAVVFAVDEDMNRTLLAIERERGLSLPEQVQRIDSLHRRYRPEAITVEANAFQSFVAEEVKRLTDAPVRPHVTHREKSDLKDGVPGMMVLFENGKYRIPRKTERDRAITDVLLRELNHMGWEGAKVKGKGAHDDCVMALWLAEQGMRRPRRSVRRFSLR